MDYIALHKTRIKQLLEEITWDGSPLVVYKQRTESDSWPFCYINSTQISSNTSGDTMDNGHYLRGYGYAVRLLWQAVDNYSDNAHAEEKLDELTGLIVDKLTSRQAKDSQDFSGNNWLDIPQVRVSNPYNAAETLQLSDTLIVKTFEFIIEQEVPYV